MDWQGYVACERWVIGSWAAVRWVGVVGAVIGMFWWTTWEREQEFGT